MAPVTGTYTFTTTSDDGVRLYVNGQLLIDNWTDHAGHAKQRAPSRWSPARSTTSGWTTTITATLATAQAVVGVSRSERLRSCRSGCCIPRLPVNQPPAVNAGADQTITLPAVASLNGIARTTACRVRRPDDTWSKISGREDSAGGTVTFAQSERAGDDGDVRRRRHLRAAADGQRRRGDGERRRDDHRQPRAVVGNRNRTRRRVLQRSRTTARTSSRSCAAGSIRRSTSTGHRRRRRPA